MDIWLLIALQALNHQSTCPCALYKAVIDTIIRSFNGIRSFAYNGERRTSADNNCGRQNSLHILILITIDRYAITIEEDHLHYGTRSSSTCPQGASKLNSPICCNIVPPKPQTAPFNCEHYLQFARFTADLDCLFHSLTCNWFALAFDLRTTDRET